VGREVLRAIAVVGVDVEDRDPEPGAGGESGGQGKSARTQNPLERSAWA
jgi:hypothetical protein